MYYARGYKTVSIAFIIQLLYKLLTKRDSNTNICESPKNRKRLKSIFSSLYNRYKMHSTKSKNNDLKKYNILK